MKRFVVLLVACAPKPEPATVSVAATASASATAAASASASAAATATAADAGPPFDLAKCGSAPGCKWSVGYQYACSGAAVRPGMVAYAPTPVCVCNGCLDNADCTTKKGGKCETFPLMCQPSAKACTYPGDLCENGGAACEKLMGTGSGPPMHKACYHDQKGHASCGPFQWPPP